jgi:RNA polymerase sigma-70 factor (sigma-E family)
VTDSEEQFAQFVRCCAPALLRAAWLLSGDWASAEDLVQAALLRTWQRWSSVRAETAQAYARRVIMTTFLGWRRRRWAGELALGWMPDDAAPGDLAVDVAEQHAVAAALLRLPRRQRAVIVLRYFDDLTEADTAAALGCSVGAVKTHASRALRTLRANPELQSALPRRTP